LRFISLADITRILSCRTVNTSEISMMSPEFPPGILPGPLLEVWQKPTFGLKLGVIK